MSAISAHPAVAPHRSTDNPVGAFLAVLAEEHVSARTARLYLGHLQRFGTWLRTQYRADLLEATTHDLREYRTHLAGSQQPASVNAALGALRRFYAWAVSTRRLTADPTVKLKPIATQPLAPKGFSTVERRRLRRAAERAGPMTDAIVTTLLNTGLRVEETKTERPSAAWPVTTRRIAVWSLLELRATPLGQRADDPVDDQHRRDHRRQNDVTEVFPKWADGSLRCSMWW